MSCPRAVENCRGEWQRDRTAGGIDSFVLFSTYEAIQHLGGGELNALCECAMQVQVPFQPLSRKVGVKV